MTVLLNNILEISSLNGKWLTKKKITKKGKLPTKKRNLCAPILIKVLFPEDIYSLCIVFVVKFQLSWNHIFFCFELWVWLVAESIRTKNTHRSLARQGFVCCWLVGWTGFVCYFLRYSIYFIKVKHAPLHRCHRPNNFV